ncbi:MAG: hypothetical protein M3362_07620 [Acidobacteriota bacterium]|nr:hypothetical protein [Acidobacteriota bacterium]
MTPEAQIQRTAKNFRVFGQGADRPKAARTPDGIEFQMTYTLTYLPGGIPMSDTTPVVMDLEHEFLALAEQWRSETMFQSLDRERACNFAYHQIIGMGKEVLPYIFRELEESTSDWFWALRAITRTDVEVKPEDRGNVHKIAEAWMKWGSDNGYVSRGRYTRILP